ncbi:MAG: 50S ribosomal protein L10 [bacterium]|nr:50S ribosomal protein L10 [bacterium]
MPKTKAQKQETIKELKENLAKTKSIVFVDIQGIKAKDLVSLRRQVKNANGVLKVAKKTLINLALKDETKIELDAQQMTGEVAVLFAADDAIKPLKALYDFSKEHGLKIIAGIFDGLLMQKENVLELAQLPSKEELLGKLVGSLASPMSGFANVLQGNIKGLIYILTKINKE